MSKCQADVIAPAGTLMPSAVFAHFTKKKRSGSLTIANHSVVQQDEQRKT